MKAWDVVGSEKDYEVGAHRFVAARHERQDGHKCDDSCEDRGLEECFGEQSRSFPTRGLAVAFAARTPGVWGGTVHEEVFEQIGNHGGSAIGSWERVGVAEEIEPIEVVGDA